MPRVVGDGHLDPAAVPEPQRKEHLARDVGPQAAEAHVQHVDGAGDQVALPPGLDDRQLDHTVDGHLGPDLLKGDHPGSQPRAGIGVDIPPVEGIALAGIRQAVDALVDHPRGDDPAHALDMGQGAVVRGDHILPAAGLDHDRAPRRAHAGVHHRDEDRPGGPVLHRLDQAVAGLPDVIGGNLMGKVAYLEILAHRIGDAVHGADRPVREAEIGLKQQGMSHVMLSFPKSRRLYVSSFA